MPSYVPPKKNIEYIIYVSLVSQANLKIFQVNPTLAAGDVKVSTDGGAEGNIATLPVVTPASSKRVKITLSTSEMNGDNVQVTLSDVSGDEWCDLTVNIQTTANQIDEIAGSGFVSSTDSNEAIRDRGDAAWITGGGAGITDILNLQPIIPASIDIANTATVRLSLMLINSLDDLPSTAEITPGTISIDRKAIGGTSWSNIVNNDACSEKAGEIYYDEVFDSGTGYVEGDSIRITFKSQKITVSANDYEITDATGVMFQTEIRQTMRGTELAALASALATAQTDLDTITGADGTTLATSQGNYAPAKVGDNMNLADDAITSAKYDESTAFPVKSDDSGSTEIARTGADGDTLETLSDQLDAVETDTQNIQSRLPAALVGGRMSSDSVSISGSTDAADKLEASAETIVTGAAAAGTLSTTEMTTNLTEDTSDHYNGRRLIWTSGVLTAQATAITDYDGATKKLTFTAVTEVPGENDTFNIV